MEIVLLCTPTDALITMSLFDTAVCRRTVITRRVRVAPAALFYNWISSNLNVADVYRVYKIEKRRVTQEHTTVLLPG